MQIKLVASVRLKQSLTTLHAQAVEYCINGYLWKVESELYSELDN